MIAYPHCDIGEDAGFFDAIHRFYKSEFIVHPIPRSERFYVLRGKSEYVHMSIGGGVKPLNTSPGFYSVAPSTIRDATFRTCVKAHCEQRGAYAKPSLYDTPSSLSAPILSVCVALKNRSRLIEGSRVIENFPRMVRSLHEAASILGPIELVVADFESSDWPLFEWLKSAGNISVTVVTVKERFSVGRGRNIAAMHASCDRLFFNDADVLVDEHVITRGLQALDKGLARFPTFQYLDFDGNRCEFEDFTHGISFIWKDWHVKAGGFPEFYFWGREDDIYCERISNFAEIERERDNGLRHQWHPAWARHQVYEDEREIEENLIGVLEVSHPKWSGSFGLIWLKKDLTMKRPSGDTGTYILIENSEITLYWDEYSSETLRFDESSGQFVDIVNAISARLKLKASDD